MLQPSPRAVWISHLSGATWLVKLDRAMELADQAIIGCAIHPHTHAYDVRARTWTAQDWRLPDLLAELYAAGVVVHLGHRATA